MNDIFPRDPEQMSAYKLNKCDRHPNEQGHEFIAKRALASVAWRYLAFGGMAEAKACNQRWPTRTIGGSLIDVAPHKL